MAENLGWGTPGITQGDPTPQGGNVYGWGSSTVTPVAPSGEGFQAAYQSTGRSLKARDLIEDTDFVEAAKVLHQMNNGPNVDPLPDNRAYAEYGIEMMGWFNYNLPKMTLDASRISGASEDQQRAFLYMMEAYDDLGLSWGGARRFFQGVLTDPTTYVGLGTFGVGTLASAGTKAATKEGVKALVRQSIRGGVIAGIEAGVYTGVTDINRQVIETSVSGEDISLGRALRAGATGAVVGFGLGTAVSAISVKAQAARAARRAEADLPDLEKGLVEEIAALPELETAAARAAQTPVGRLRTQMDTVVKAIKRLVPEGKVVALSDEGVQKLDELVKAAEPLQEIVIKAGARHPSELAEFILKHERTEFESNFLQTVTNQTVSALKTQQAVLIKQQAKLKGDAAKVIAEQIDKIEEVLHPIQDIDVALSTITAQTLRARKEGINIGELRKMSLSSLQDQGLSRTDAEKKFEEVVSEKLLKKAKTQEIRDLNKQIAKAYEEGNQTEYIQLKEKKRQKIAEVTEEVLRQEEGGFSAFYRRINKPIKVLNEVMISFVFSPATVIINTVPSLAKVIYKPFLNNLMKDGLSRSSLKTMMAEYSAMASVTGTAIKAAKAAWKYERSILTGDSARFLEEYNTIPKKYRGGTLRFFPRILLATDALFENIHYRGYIVGKSTSDALERGTKKGLTGKELDDFVEERVQKAVKKAYKPEENMTDILMSEGISRGLKGQKLENFIKNEIAQNEDTFIKARSEEGRNYVQDVLFKRDFTGEGAASGLAKGYEAFVNKNPIMRLMGQLFFRTPVRVFEEGIRLTPGLNLISPKFLADLSGKNGQMRQIRAHGEAMTSYAIAGSIFSMYATGNITGSLGTNYKQRRQAENTGQLEPYSIRFSDGSTFNYRNFDPFATPVKIIVNALERAETLAYRAEQGERMDQSSMMKIYGYMAVAVGSIAQSIRDANLASGVDAISTLVEDLQDEEGSEQVMKFVGQKIQTLLPNTYYKIQMLDNPVLSDPASIEQFIRYRLNPEDPLVPKQYTALGRARTLSNPMANLIYFDPSTPEEKRRGLTDKELEVEQFLYRLAQVGDTHFTAPYKHPLLPNDDLRTRRTSDGEESYYDRWMRYVHESRLVDALHTLRGLPMGTASDPGIAELEARKLINAFRREAFLKLMREEMRADRSVRDEYIQSRIIQAENKAGQSFVPNLPF